MINLKNGCSPSYLSGNLAKSDTFVAYVKNGFGTSMVVIYKLDDIENESMQ